MTKALIVLLLALLPQSEMVTPKVEHQLESHTTTTDFVTHSCPDGYEGHYVDVRPGFEWNYWAIPSNGLTEVAFTVCFKKEFMDALRKNPEMQSHRPLPPRGV